MKWEEDNSIIHGVFVDDFVTIKTSQKLKDGFEALNAAEFDVTSGCIMGTFLGLEWSKRTGTSLYLTPIPKSSLSSFTRNSEICANVAWTCSKR
jgi:hypothetical protein